MSTLKTVFQWIEASREEIIRLQSELTSRPALSPVNGGEGEHVKAEYLKGLVEKLAPESMEELRAPDERAKDGYRPNLIARWKGEVGAPAVWVLSHMDIVPPGDPSLWDGDPYRLSVENDRMIGRGVQDNQHGIVSSLIALWALRESGFTQRRAVALGFLADEETGSRYGLQYVLENRRELFGPRDLIIVPDAGNEEGTMIEVAEKSMLWLKFTVTGLQCHASTPEKGKNSLVGAARLILALETLKKTYDRKDELFKPPYSTFESTRMEANVPNVNTLPGRNVFYMDCRILPRYRVDEVLSAAKGIADEVARSQGLSIRVETVQRLEASVQTDPDSPVVRDLIRAIRAVSGREAKPMGIGGGTVAALFREAGLAAAVWMTAPDSAHQPNEFCLISDIMNDAKVLACLYLNEFGPVE